MASYIQSREQNIKGFSAQNIWWMKQFYETYKGNEKLATLWRELSWTNNVLIFTQCKSVEEREFYLRMTIKERWSSRDLERQLDSSYGERVMIGNAKLSSLPRELPQDITNTFKDS